MPDAVALVVEQPQAGLVVQQAARLQAAVVEVEAVWVGGFGLFAAHHHLHTRVQQRVCHRHPVCTRHTHSHGPRQLSVSEAPVLEVARRLT